MKNLNSSTIISIVVTTLLVGSLFWLMVTKRVNSSLETGLQEERLRSETLLSEKLLLEKEMERLSQELTQLAGRNAGLDELVQNTSQKLRDQETEYNRLKRENAGLHLIKKQRQELAALNKQLQQEIETLTIASAKLENHNAELGNRIAFLEEQNRKLTGDLQRALWAAVDQSQIQAVKGKKEKLTVRARQAKKLVANFEVASGLRNLSFRIADASGKPLSAADGDIAFTSAPSENNITASADATTSGNKLQKVQMTFMPKRKLSTGVYTVEILNDNLYVGSIRVKLK